MNGAGVVVAVAICGWAGMAQPAAAATVMASASAPAPAVARIGRGRRGAGARVESRPLHVRVATRRGPIHVFRPAGYDRRTAGVVVYVHGYFIRADKAWREHKLAAQFTASKINALFIVPEAPASSEQRSAWTDLSTLMKTALKRARIREPPGPVVVVGHSGAYRTIVSWLGHPRLRHLVLLDALYGNQGDFRDWLDRSAANQLTLVVRGTAKWADPFVQAAPDAVTVAQIPLSIDDLSPEERNAKLLCLRSQYGHFEIVTEGKTIPVVLKRAPLPATKRRVR